MTAYINKIADKAGVQQLPVTHERAVRDDNGATLESKMQNLEGAMDKAYVASSDNGMGRITLKKNMVSGVNTLTQSMIQTTNTIYVIRYDFTLGEDITVPANCVLEFDGGSISGAYTLTGAKTGINAGLVKIFNTNVTLDGTWDIKEIYPQWFGAVINNNTVDNSIYIQKAIYYGKKFNKLVLLPPGNYYTSEPIELYGFMEFAGSGYKNTSIITTANKCIIAFEETDSQDTTKYTCTETVIRDISFVGNNSNIGIDGNCTYAIINNVQLTSFNIAFNINKSWGMRFNCVKCLACTYIQRNKNNQGGYENAIYYHECEFYDCTNGIEIYSGNGFVIDKCLFERVNNCITVIETSRSITLRDSYFEACDKIINLSGSNAHKKCVFGVHNNTFIFNQANKSDGCFVSALATDNADSIRTHIHVVENQFNSIDNQKDKLFYVPVESGKNYFPFALSFLRNTIYNATTAYSLRNLFGEQSMFPIAQSNSTLVNSDVPIFVIHETDSGSGENFIAIFAKGERMAYNKQILQLIFNLKNTSYIDNNYEIGGDVIPTYLLAYADEYYGVYSAKLQNDTYVTGSFRVVTNSVRISNLSETSPKYISGEILYGKSCIEASE